MDFETYIELLEDALKKPLPGEKAHLEMSSVKRIQELMELPEGLEAMESSVMILLFPYGIKHEVSIVLIRRPQYNGVHSGQIALPGGRFEPGDEDPATTALRETYEEVGIEPKEIRIIGKLSELYIPPSNYNVHPFVGYLNYSPCFYKDDDEVEEIIVIRLSDIINDAAILTKEFKVSSGLVIEAPCFVVDGYEIWGATAMMLNELKAVIRKI
jgi:8-oxo-dGTP pyrophosphatase MutT (NUDIX family)